MKIMETSDEDASESHERFSDAYVWRPLPAGAPPYDEQVWSPAAGLLPQTRKRFFTYVLKIWQKKQEEYGHAPPQGVYVVEHVPLPETDITKEPRIETPTVRVWFLDGYGIVETTAEPPAREVLALVPVYYAFGIVHIAPCVGSNALCVIESWGPRAAKGQWISIEPHHAITRIEGGTSWVS